MNITFCDSNFTVYPASGILRLGITRAEIQSLITAVGYK
jgi:hypothetical protein